MSPSDYARAAERTNACARASPTMEGTGNTAPTRRTAMKLAHLRHLRAAQQGRVGYILLWLLGVPIPILFLIYLLRGCT
jgi:hypothetical protein